MPVVSVLWALGLLAAVSLSILWNSTMLYRQARNALDSATIIATAEAAVNRAVLALLDPEPQKRWKFDGTPQRFEFNGAMLNVSIQDELGRIDLNQASPALLTGLLRSAGLDLQSASDLVERIADWRRSGMGNHPMGTSDDASGDVYQPRHGPFQSVDELLLVRGMMPNLFKMIASALTVYSGRQFVDSNVAPRSVLLAILEIGAGGAETVLAVRTQTNPVSYGNEMAQLRGRAFTVRAKIERASTITVQQIAIRMTDNPALPFWVLNWRSE